MLCENGDDGFINITRMHGNAKHDGLPLAASKLWSYFSLFVDQSPPGIIQIFREQL